MSTYDDETYKLSQSEQEFELEREVDSPPVRRRSSGWEFPTFGEGGR
jgi:hypothetical protein